MMIEKHAPARLNSWLALIANLGVIGGLIFLGLEIKQNTTQLRAEAGYSINEALSELNSAVYADAQLADILKRGHQSLSSLDSTEISQFFAFQFNRINLALYIQKLERDGVSQVHFPYIEHLTRQFHQNPGLQEFLLAVDADYVGDRELFNQLRKDHENE